MGNPIGTNEMSIDGGIQNADDLGNGIYGIYITKKSCNYPVDDTYGILISFVGYAGSRMQIFYCNNLHIYTRLNWNQWWPWVKLNNSSL